MKNKIDYNILVIVPVTVATNGIVAQILWSIFLAIEITKKIDKNNLWKNGENVAENVNIFSFTAKTYSKIELENDVKK